MKTTIIANDFHGTEYKTRKSREELDAIAEADPEELGEAEKAFVKRAFKALCGVEGCRCARNVLGERP